MTTSSPTAERTTTVLRAVTAALVVNDALATLAVYRWPGNVRELRNTVERLMILSPGPTVEPSDVDLLASGRSLSTGLAAEFMQADTFADFKERAERAFILQKLRESDWNVAETARRMDMPRSNLYKKIERYGLVRDG
jgi:two-component system nitrogen regulation response regulator NtrX